MKAMQKRCERGMKSFHPMVRRVITIYGDDVTHIEQITPHKHSKRQAG